MITPPTPILLPAFPRLPPTNHRSGFVLEHKPRGIWAYAMITIINKKCDVVLFSMLLTGGPCLAGAFVNLGFDQTAIPPDFPIQIPGPPFSFLLGDWVRPGWQSRPQTSVGYNYSQNFAGWASIVDRDFRDTHFGKNAPAPVVGTFSLAVWPLSGPIGPGEYEPYKLTQTGDIPLDAQSLRFLYHGNDLRVFLADSERTLQPLPDVISGDPQIPLYHYFAVDVSPYAGQTVELRFEFRSQGYDDFRLIPPRLPGEPDAQSHVLDDLSFSPLPAVPEPSTWALLGLGVAALAWGSRKRRDES